MEERSPKGQEEDCSEEDEACSSGPLYKAVKQIAKQQAYKAQETKYVADYGSASVVSIIRFTLIQYPHRIML